MNVKVYFGLIFQLVSITTFSQSAPGFFINDLEPKTAAKPTFVEMEKPDKVATATIVINAADRITPVSKYLFGNNANPYMTQIVDQPVLLQRIQELSPNVIRFPGGNLSSIYFWNRSSNQPPSDAPLKLLDASGVEQNSGYWYGKNTESWTLSLDNYYKMLEETNSSGIITINYGYARYSMAEDPVAAAAHLAADWVRYDNGRTKFWEIGNESNGAWQAGYRIKTADNKDGQPEIITGSLYGKHFKVFADSMRKAATEKGATIYIGAQLLQEEPASWWNATDKTWNTGVFQETKNLPDYYIIHSYYTPYNTNSKAADIISSAVTVTENMMAYIMQSQSQAGVTVKPIALTEWNIFAIGSKQQVSYINGMHAAMVLGELIKNKYGLACRWDLANAWDSGNDHGMFNQGDEPGGIPKWNARAVFYYMYFFQKYTGDHMVQSNVTGNADIVSYASTFDGKDAGVVVVNKGTSEQTVKVEMQNFSKGERYYMHILTGGTDNGEFSLKVFVNKNGPSIASGGPPAFEAIPAQSTTINGGIIFTAPPRSVAYVLVEHGDEVTATMDVEEVKLNVFPNPSSGKLTIQLPAGGFRNVEVFDISGKSIYHQSLELSQTSVEIDPSPIRGVYLIRLSGGKNDFITKVVVE